MEETVEWPGGVCKKGVGDNSILCSFMVVRSSG